MLRTEFVPANAGTDRLMVVLHGLGDSLEGYRWLPQALRLPFLNYLLVNAPDVYYGGFAWYDIDRDSARGIERSRQLLFSLLNGQREKGFPSEQTVVFGFSQGGLLAIEIGARYPHRLAGIVGISGYVQEAEKLARELSPVARQQRFFLTHGTADPLIPIDWVRPQIEILRQAGLQIEWQEFAKGHTIVEEPELAVIRDFVSDRTNPRL
jgi:phospholipase/carboxylesterase